MSVQLICDQCGEICDIGVSTVELRRVQILPRANRVENYDDWPTIVHWSCLIPFVQRRDAEDKEPPF